MKVALALLLNMGLLAVLVPWLWRQWRWAGAGWWRWVLGLGFGLRMTVGVVKSCPPKLDAEFMNGLSHFVTDQLRARPSQAWGTLTKALTVIPMGRYDAVYQNMSNTWIFVKLLAVLNLGSLGMGWLNGLYISLFAFVGCWQLVRCLAEVLPRTPAGAGVVAFLLWPSVCFWATGISKEAALLGSGTWLTARVLRCLYGKPTSENRPGWQSAGWWLGTAALVLLHFQMRYFFALPLLGVLGGVALGQWLERYGLARQRWAQVAVLVGVLGTGAWLAPKVSIAFSVNKFTNQVIRVYSHEVANSVGRPHFEYPNLRPTLESIAAHAPLAAVNALTRPWFGESWQPLFLAASLENVGLLVLFVLAMVATAKGRPGYLPFGLGVGLVFICLILAVLIGLTTPNLGSLNRYRNELLPFFLLLVLQNDYAAAFLKKLGLGARREPDMLLTERPARPVP